jgi:HEAT repeat protein
MESIFEKLWRIGAAAFVLKAIVAAVAGDLLLLGFILLRRTYRKRYFARRDARAFRFRQQWDALISGEIPYDTWREKSFDRRIVETMVLDALEAANPKESARLLGFLRSSGLIDKRIFEARHHRGWRRWRALVALGRTRAPEGITALAEGLRDRRMDTRMASLRGLGRMACPEAASEILTWVGEAGLVVPALPLQSALIPCCAEKPQLLLPYLQHAAGPVREMLGRVLGEVATASLGADLLQFAEDPLDELRAAAARAMPHAQPRLAVEILSQLAQDSVWFVRLRAIVSLGKLGHPDSTPVLLKGTTDSNRLVRLRAAEALVDFKTGQISIFEQVVALQDRYGLHAYLTALENAGLRANLETDIKAVKNMKPAQKAVLIEVLQKGTPTVEQPAKTETVTSDMAVHS